jgi:HSP20 family protein
MAEVTEELQKKEVETKEGTERTRTRKVYIPAVDIIEKKGEILLVADMPGVDEKSLDVTLEKNVLTLYGKVAPVLPEGHRLIASEYGIGDYQRAFAISDEIDRDRIGATVKSGVLRLVLPKSESAKSRKIAVTVE